MTLSSVMRESFTDARYAKLDARPREAHRCGPSGRGHCPRRERPPVRGPIVRTAWRSSFRRRREFDVRR